MQRLTISIDDDLAKELDRLIQKRSYSNRSEVFRDLLRKELLLEQTQDNEREAMGVVSYLFNHHHRQLSSRLVKEQHEHFSHVVTTLHLHLNHDQCLEVCILKGALQDVKCMADSIISETSVEHGNVTYYLTQEDENKKK